MQRWMLGLLAVLFSATLATAQQQPTTRVTPQRGEIPQIVAFDNEGLLGDHIHIFGNTPDLGKWGSATSMARSASHVPRIPPSASTRQTFSR